MPEDYKAIILPSGHEAFVSVEDFERVSALRWYVQPVSRKSGAKLCALNAQQVGGKRRCVFMHSFIVNTPGCDVSHVNGNGLDNRRSNLATGTHSFGRWGGDSKKGERLSLVCAGCGEQFERVVWRNRGLNNKRYFCNKACRGWDGNGLVKFNCDYCGKEDVKPRAQFRRFTLHFCKDVCQQAYQAVTLNGKPVQDNTIYTAEIMKRIFTWEGSGCAFPLCTEPARSHKSAKWRLCSYHGKRFSETLSHRRRRNGYCTV